MRPIIFTLFNFSEMTQKIAEALDIEIGEMTFHRFPDGEGSIQIHSDIKNRDVIILTSLNFPDQKILPLIFFANTAKSLGAKRVGLVAPYLAYLRQDKQFHPGESVTSRYFANLLSHTVDWLMTIDPHLHRYASLNEIYSVPTWVLHAADEIAKWIQAHVKNPILIGPDSESRQWVMNIAERAGAPFLVLEKKRYDDKHVEVNVPDLSPYPLTTPVLVDDIISTARTMLSAVNQLKRLEIKSMVCIGVHGIFAEDSYQALLKTRIAKVVTCNTISHLSNDIDVSDTIIRGLREMS